MDKKLKITFAPGCFDNFDGSQEELDELIKSLETAEFHKNSTPVDMEKLELEDPELFEILTELFEKLDNDDNPSPRKLH